MAGCADLEFPEGGLLPGWATLVRATRDFGLPMTVDELRWSVGKPIRDGYDFYGLSVATFPCARPKEIVARRRIRNTHYAVARHWKLKSHGFHVTLANLIGKHSPGHATILFDEDPADECLAMLIRLFSDPIPNPGGRPRRRFQ
jgi:hypothetical protein